MAEKSKEVVLALSGGGARGTYHLGVLQYLDEQDIKVKAICCTSIGSIVACSYASGISPMEQLKIFKSKDVKKMFSFAWFKEAIFKIDIRSSAVSSLLVRDKIEDLDIPVYITSLDLETGKEIVFESGDTKMVCQAASALVPMFKPVEYDGQVLVDGGFGNNLPYIPLFKYDLPMIGVNLTPLLKKPSRKRLLSYLKKVIAIKMYNHVDKQTDIFDHYISNDEIIDYSIFSLKNFDKLFDMGYEDAKKVLVNV